MSGWGYVAQLQQGNRHTEEREDFPVLRVKKLSTTFRLILLLCNEHPGSTKTIEDVSTIGDSFEKYCIDYAIERLEEIVSVSALIRKQALDIGNSERVEKLGRIGCEEHPFRPVEQRGDDGRAERHSYVALCHATGLPQEVQ
ncbi:hypothetical protein EDD18DRAFT_1365895 [Armillaria luteobubalina]|uniref:Uncharacterized protein n=1 Tax=Armillaria luteobubalina TaxID=153913 RepID=A0AA39P3L9_9AGAR|nr:hypothetical protein EDD18DRAFT_1365895 [Armillaria luteobubalina]